MTVDPFETFLKERFEKRKEGWESLSQLKAAYFEARTREIIKALTGVTGEDDSAFKEYENFLQSKGVQIVTVRRAFTKGSEILKPVASFPEETLKLAEDLAYQAVPQQFSTPEVSLADIEKCVIDDPNESDKSRYFSAVYETTGTSGADGGDSPRFKDRIDAAFKKFKEKDRTRFGDGSTCFFSVRARPGEDGELQIAQILAIYFEQGTNIRALREAHALSRRMFEQDEQIRVLEEQLFVLEGHELTNSLQPLFLDENIAPADKVAFALEKLNKLLERHLRSHYPVSNPDKHKTSVYFVSLGYEVRDDKNKETILPIFQVYPHVYRRELAYGAFLIGHPKRPAVSKYLLRKYLTEKENPKFLIGERSYAGTDTQPAKLHEDFGDTLFNDIDKLIKGSGGRLQDGGKPDQIFLAKSLESDNGGGNDQLWDMLNVNVGEGTKDNGKEPNRSILAYVVEGREIAREKEGDKEIVYRQLPRGILAIESTHREMLSDTERESLREVAKAFAHLLRHIFHDNTLLDYRPQLSEAYANYTGPSNKLLGQRLLLAAQSIDADLLKSILEAANDDKKFGAVAKKVSTVYDKIFSETEIADNEIKLQEVVRDRIGRRFERASEYLKNEGAAGLSEDVVEFLEACPRNFAWAGYAPSLAQALGDRADHAPPRFTLMSPGYSASGLYMAVVEGEIRQVAKLSRVDKLGRERKNYREHVRYKVLVAARAPSDAFAFDSTGKGGRDAGRKGDPDFRPDKEEYETKCYGVLVADLASSRKLDPERQDTGTGGEEVATFLDRAFEVVFGNDKAKFEEVTGSLRSLFADNLGHWFSNNHTDPADGRLNLLLRASRLDYEKRLEGRLKEEDSSPEITPPEAGNAKGWAKYAFERLNNGASNALVEYEKGSFPFENLLLKPDRIAEYCVNEYTNGRGLEDDEIKKMLSIAHQDLNTQNLVWAGPIQSFMMIDFEHTGLGFWGMDQTRLAVNTVVDFLSKVEGRFLQENAAKEVAGAAQFIVDAWRAFNTAQKWRKLWMIEKEHGKGYSLKEPGGFPEQDGQRLKRLVEWIIWLIWQEEKRFRPDENRKLLHLYQAELGFSMVKEYEYSMVNVRRANLPDDQIVAVNTGVASSKNGSDLKDVLTKIGESFNLSDIRARHQFGAVARFLVARWMLNEILPKESEKKG